MVSTLLLDIEAVDSADSPGHTTLTARELDLYRHVFADTAWAPKLFSQCHVGHWDDEKNPEHLRPFSFSDDVSAITLAEGKHIVHLLSDAFSRSTHLRYEDRRIILSLAHNRCTLRVPAWLLRGEHLPARCGSELSIFTAFRQLIDNVLERLPPGMFLRRANLRVAGLEFRKYRPAFDTFFLAENVLEEWLNIRRYSSRRQAPGYLEQLKQHPGFPGVERALIGEYLHMQWMAEQSAGDAWDDRRAAEVLSRRHAWLGRSGLIPRHRDFNALGDKKYLQSAKVLLRPPHVVKAGGRNAFVLLSTHDDISEQDWQNASHTIEDLKQNADIRKIHLVVANRRLCFEYFAKVSDSYGHGVTLSYLDGKHIFTPFPDGMWLNDSCGEISACYAMDDPRLENLMFRKFDAQEAMDRESHGNAWHHWR